MKQMRSPLTTLCYIEKDEQYLMMYRNKKKQDINEGKWIGVGGHFEWGESPEECLLREVYEETGLTLTHYRFRGIVTFCTDESMLEYMCLYTADAFEGELKSDCAEGELKWIPKKNLMNLKLWEGDKLFLKLLLENSPFFSMKLSYKGDQLEETKIHIEKTDVDKEEKNVHIEEMSISVKRIENTTEEHNGEIKEENVCLEKTKVNWD